ncbi:MAG: hypothetical protein HQM12_20245 [SAR324 cluster bacterium]|nr:hypothetical protein [SAR324 cluster bacterium]
MKPRHQGILQRNSSLLRWLIQTTDILIGIVTAVFTHWYRFGQWEMSPPYLQVIILGGMMVALIFPMFPNLYTPLRGRSLSSEIGTVIQAWGTVTILFMIMGFMTQNFVIPQRDERFSRLWFFHLKKNVALEEKYFS